VTAVVVSTILAGFGLGASLIVAIGAQNAFVLRQGLKGEHVGAIVVVCALSDMLLIALGTGALEQVSRLAAWLFPVLRYGGAAFLAVYGALSLRRAFTRQTLDGDAGGPAQALWPCLATCLALTWLNPHVYLDTVLLIGSVALGHRPDQWWFAGGAMAASWCWFPLLGYGAGRLRPLFASVRAWRVLDVLIALVMWAVAVSLLVRG